MTRALFLLVVLAAPSFAVTVTTTAGCTTAQPVTSTINFNGQNTTDAAGHATYSGTTTFNGGTNPGCTGDWLFQNATSTTITFDSAIDYFGLAWGTKDSNNSVQLYNGTSLVFTQAGSNLANLYVNFFAGAGEQFTKVVLSSGGCCFESDNHSYRRIDVAGQAVPEPSTFGLAALALAGLMARRKLAFHK